MRPGGSRRGQETLLLSDTHDARVGDNDWRVRGFETSQLQVSYCAR